MLTRSQKAALDFIIAYQAENGGVSPTMAEMRDGLGYTSKSIIHRFLQQLELRGVITRDHHQPRSIRIVADRIPIYQALDIEMTRYQRVGWL